MNKNRLIMILLVLAVFASTPAHAFKRTLTLSGLPIWWADDDMPIQIELNDQINDEQMQAIIAAFNAWNRVPTAYFSILYDDVINKSLVENDGINIIMYSYTLIEGTIAQTTTFYYVNTGQILESDMELNADLEWSTTKEPDKLDTQSIITHETGHIAGLDDLYESQDSEATMYASALQGETKKRSLDKDDEDGVTSIYPVSLPGTYSISGKILLRETEESTASLTRKTSYYDPTAGSGTAEEEDPTLDGVVVTITGNASKRATSENGYYAFHNLDPGSYQLTAYHEDYVFDPVSVTLQVTDSHILRVDFNAELGAGTSPAVQPTQEEEAADGDSGGCYLATFSFGGSRFQVNILKEFRDRFLLRSETGRVFVNWYYRVSPELVTELSRLKLAAPMTRTILAPLVLLAAVVCRISLIHTVLTVIFLIVGTLVIGRNLLRANLK